MKSANKTQSPSPAAGATAFEQLDAVLRLLVGEHEKLLELAGEYRRAIAQADGPGLARCMGAQQQVVQRITGLERQRQTVVAGLVRGAGNGQTRLSEVTAGAPEPMRRRLEGVAGGLRDLLGKLHQEHQALKLAAETLSMHMEGLLRQVCRGMSHTGTYARCGSIDSMVQVVSAVDVRS